MSVQKDSPRRLTIASIQDLKNRGERIPMLTAYDYTTAKLVDEAGVPMILVGDSLGMVVLGYDSTLPVTLDEMIHHTKAVVRGTKRALVIADLPFLTYQVSETEAIKNAGRVIQETGAQAVKLEGGEAIAPTVRRLVQCGIPVMGHIGLTPQSVNQLGGFKVQGKTPAAAVGLINDALAIEAAGAFALVLECIPAPLARMVTERLRIPTIGIGAGPHCDGEVQVVSDILGLFTDFVPKHAKRYTTLADTIKEAVGQYAADVRAREFPGAAQSYKMSEDVLAELRQLTPAGH
ncbi:MAG TPA: 3-methyl-2-oxobutanoate hydroxymethyltransferase [Dehalococcoidia bacterium]|nr:3-methyl-2-oxobutanoate hydroxymethyltransferase [Dehalococcoidia bacterium]